LLNNIEGNLLIIECNSCGNFYSDEIRFNEIKWIPMFQTYESYNVSACEICGNAEGYNIAFEKDEDITTIELQNIPNKEVNQRKYLRDLKSMLTFETKY
jgi:hypothetical protein